jgi:hypothetical protein
MSNFEVVSKLWRAAKFTINIVKLPSSVINDKLAVLSDGTGTLSFSRFDQFLLNNCVLDGEKIYRFLDSLEDDPEKMVGAAVELRQLIIEVNPLLEPDLLVINNENRIKIAEQTDKPEDVRKLVDNSDWDKPEFNEDDEEDDIENFVRSLPPPMFPFGKTSDNGDQSKMVPHLWDETDLLLIIVQHDVNDIPEVFKDRYSFTDEAQYKLFIVTRCIADFQNLFVLIDRMGFTKKWGPEKITEMLYDISIKYNTFLAWSEIDLDKVKKVVQRKFGKKRRDKNLFRKKPNNTPGPVARSNKAIDGDSEGDTDFYTEFDDLSEEDVLSLSERTKKWVIGQDIAIDKICETVHLAKCGLKEQNTPIGVFMLTGGTGTGKTWTARMLAQELCGDEHSMIRIDCSEYSQAHEVSKLIGAPSGYVGFEEGGYLTNNIMKKPFSVVLFDEIEKAHPKLHNILLQIFDEGRLTSNKGETVSFGETVIIMTSNVGVKEVSNIGARIGVGDTAMLTKDKQERAIAESLKNNFKPEFLNRIDGVITFNELTTEDCIRIIGLAFDKLNGWLDGRNVNVTHSKKATDYIYKVGFTPGFGARPLNRAMRREIMLPISKIMLKQRMTKDCTIKIDVKKDVLTFDVKAKAPRVVEEPLPAEEKEEA